MSMIISKEIQLGLWRNDLYFDGFGVFADRYRSTRKNLKNFLKQKELKEFLKGFCKNFVRSAQFIINGYFAYLNYNLCLAN